MTIKKTEMMNVTSLMNETVTFQRLIQKPMLKYKTRQVKRKAIRMIEEIKTTEKQIPMTVPVPRGNLDKILDQDRKNCECYKEDCECYGKPGCDCCYPDCQCMPSMISPTESEYVIFKELLQVPQEYIETISLEVPEIYMVDYYINDTQMVLKNVTRFIPHIVETIVMVNEPEIYYVNTTQEIPVTVVTQKLVDVPIEVEVLKESQVPVIVDKEYEVLVPVEEEKWITEQKSVLEHVLVDMPYAVEV